MPQTYAPARIFMNNYLSYANGYISMFALEMTQKKKGPTYLFDIENPLTLRGTHALIILGIYTALTAAT